MGFVVRSTRVRTLYQVRVSSMCIICTVCVHYIHMNIIYNMCATCYMYQITCQAVQVPGTGMCTIIIIMNSVHECTHVCIHVCEASCMYVCTVPVRAHV